MTHRLLRRGTIVLANSAHSLLPPVLGFATAWLAIRFGSLQLWGGFVALWAVVQLAVHVVAWGNKEDLLREFSHHPAELGAAWRSSLVTRLSLLVPLSLLALLAPVPPATKVLLPVWALLLALQQSFDVLVLYRRAFVAGVAVEVAGFTAVAAAIATAGEALTVSILVLVFITGTVLRVGSLAALFRRDIARGDRHAPLFDSSVLRRAFPFFVLGLTGMLMSRTDLYCVVALLDRASVGTYQILTGFLLYLQSLSALILMPFVKGLYRLPVGALRSLSLRLPLLGVAATVAGCVFIYTVMRQVYGLEVAPRLVAVGGLSVLPMFAALPLIYLAYRNGRQRYVVWVNVLGIAVNLALNLALLPRLGLLGAVTATAAANWVMLGAYVARDRLFGWENKDALPELS